MNKVERVIVQAKAAGEAKAELERWRERHSDVWSHLVDGDIIVQQVRGDSGKSQVRYVLRLSEEDAREVDRVDSAGSA